VFEHSKLILCQMHLFRNFLFWQCQLQCKQSCQKLIHCHATQTQSCFVVFCFMAGAQSPVAFILQFRPNFICCLHLLGYDKIK